MTFIYEKQLTELEIEEQKAYLRLAQEVTEIEETKLRHKENALNKLKKLGLTEAEVEALLEPR